MLLARSLQIAGRRTETRYITYRKQRACIEGSRPILIPRAAPKLSESDPAPLYIASSVPQSGAGPSNPVNRCGTTSYAIRAVGTIIASPRGITIA